MVVKINFPFNALNNSNVCSLLSLKTISEVGKTGNFLQMKYSIRKYVNFSLPYIVNIFNGKSLFIYFFRISKEGIKLEGWQRGDSTYIEV